MNARERYVAAMTFGTPDRVPFTPGGPRESTLTAWRGQGLPAGADWRAVLLDTLHLPAGIIHSFADVGADFRMIPQFEEKVLEHKDGHYVVQDWKGNVCEISDQFDVSYLREARDFVTRRWIRCPVENAGDWERMKPRYDVNSPGRLPRGEGVSPLGPAGVSPADECKETAGEGKMPSRHKGGTPSPRQVPIRVAFAGPFWQMREWCGFEGLCLMMIEQPDLVDRMAAFWADFVAAMLERIFRHVTPDAVLIGEDMAYKIKAMISPAMTRRFVMPSWKRWGAMAKRAGVPVLEVDSDGYVGELIPLWIESGVNVCSPMEVAAGCDLVEFRRQFGRRIAYSGGVDKRCIARGGESIRRELDRLAPVIKDGGFLPSCDHGVPSDVSWPDFVDYARLLARLTGWL